MRVSLLHFNEITNEYDEFEFPVDDIGEDFTLFPIVSNRCLFNTDEGEKPVEFYVKIYKD